MATIKPGDIITEPVPSTLAPPANSGDDMATYVQALQADVAKSNARRKVLADNSARIDAAIAARETQQS